MTTRASFAYFDWPGVIPHHYLVTNYTNWLSIAMKTMTNFPREDILAFSCVDGLCVAIVTACTHTVVIGPWHATFPMHRRSAFLQEYVKRGVNTIDDPWLP